MECLSKEGFESWEEIRRVLKHRGTEDTEKRAKKGLPQQLKKA
jgi:hypothetical protein